MATYALDDYKLRFNMSGTIFHLEVLNLNNTLVESYDLMLSSSCVTLTVVSDDYVIGTGTTIGNDEEAHKHQVGGSNTQTFAMATLTGIGIMDLRDMGRQGSFTASYDLACCTLRIDGKSGTYPLWIKVTSTDCVTIDPAS